jgi:hypothetical protein
VTPAAYTPPRDETRADRCDPAGPLVDLSRRSTDAERKRPMTKPLSDYTDAEIREQLVSAAEHVTYYVTDYLGELDRRDRARQEKELLKIARASAWAAGAAAVAAAIAAIAAIAGLLK